MVAFFESPRFSESISEGSQGGPTFSTDVFEGTTGLEQRASKWSTARHSYDVSFGIRTRTDMDTIRTHFGLTRGRATAFRFKDWNDYQIVSGSIGTGDGVTTVFDIVKVYTTGAYTYTRRILKIVASTVSVRVNSVLKTEGVDYTVDYNTGEVTFTAAPTSTHPITITCEFDVPVRFDMDNIMPSHEGYLAESVSSINLIEVLYSDLDF